MIGQPFLLIAAATLACYAVSNDDSRCAFAIPEVALSARTFSSVPGINGGLSMDKKKESGALPPDSFLDLEIVVLSSG